MFSKINTQIAERLDARRNGDKGFTLVELLVVVIIIGILAAIAIPVFLNQREAAWRSSVEADVRNAALAVETYATTNNGSLAGLGATAINLSDTTTPSIRKGANNTITLTVTGNTYTIQGSSTDLTNPASDRITYNSASGGLGKWN